MTNVVLSYMRRVSKSGQAVREAMEAETGENARSPEMVK